MKNSKEIAIKTYGDSMRPFFWDGDTVYLKKIGFYKIKVNDYITFKKGPVFVTHRVVYKPKDKKYVVTKGDNNPLADGKVYSKQIIGKVFKVKRNNSFFDPDQFYLFQSSIYFNEITKIKEKLEEINLEFVFLKGLPLHLHFEKTHPKRLYIDCDILIKRQDFSAVERSLKKEGYKKEDAPLSKNLRKIKSKDNEISFSKVVNNFKVTFDVHLEAVFLMIQLGQTNLIYPQKLVDEFSRKLIEQKEQIEIEGVRFPILSTENLFIYLSLHLFHHNFKGYYRYEFIKIVAAQKKLNYKEVAEKINFFKLNNYIFPVFLLLKKYYKIDFPSNFLNSIKPNKKTLTYIEREIKKMDIFGDELRISAGVKRFKYIFLLSPIPICKRIFIITKKEVFFSIVWILVKKINSLNQRKNFSLH